MPWSGSAPNQTFGRDTGVYSGTTAWQQTDAASRGIRSDDHDTHDQDIATSLNLALLKNGGNTLTASIPAGGFGMTGVGVLGSATEASIASSSTTDLLGSAALFNLITGTTTITSLGTGTNRFKIARFNGALLLTHNATSLILPGAADITTAAGDVMGVVSDGSSNARVVWYSKASGVPYAQAYQPGSVLLTSGTTSGATLDIPLTSYTGFRGFKIYLSGFLPATNSVQLWLRVSTDGGSNYATSGYNWAFTQVSDGATPGTGGSGSDAKIVIDSAIGNGSTQGYNGEITLLNQTSSAFWTRVHFIGYTIDSSANGQATNGGGSKETAQDTDAIRFMFSSGNISAGNYAVYGLV